MSVTRARPLRAVVVVPARDEEARVGACLDALAAQTVALDSFAVVVVLDACRDATEQVVASRARDTSLELVTIRGLGAGPGWARRLGMDLACALLLGRGDGSGLIANTDADTRTAPDWLVRQLQHVGRGARVIAGLIELDELEAAALGDGVLAHRARNAKIRLDAVHGRDPTAGHHHFGGASFSVTVDAYRAVGGLEPVAELEDAAFERRLVAHGLPVLRAADVRVRTSARLRGRVPRGLAVDLAAAAALDRAN